MNDLYCVCTAIHPFHPAANLEAITFQLLKVARLSDDQLAFRAQRLLTKTVLETQRLPDSMVLEDVRRARDENGDPREYVYSGGFGDVYQGRWGEEVVAIKSLKPSATSVGDHSRVRSSRF